MAVGSLGNDKRLFCLLELEPHAGQVRLEMKPQRLKLGVKYLVCRKLSDGQKVHKEDEMPFYVPHKSISRRHALLWCRPNAEGGLELRVRDAGTTNGTYVNDERLAPGGVATKIVGGDGGVTLRFGEIPHTFRAWCVVGEAGDASSAVEASSRGRSEAKAPERKAPAKAPKGKAAVLAATAARLAEIEGRLAAQQGSSMVVNKPGGSAPNTPDGIDGVATPDVLLDSDSGAEDVPQAADSDPVVPEAAATPRPLESPLRSASVAEPPAVSASAAVDGRRSAGADGDGGDASEGDVKLASDGEERNARAAALLASASAKKKQDQKDGTSSEASLERPPAEASASATKKRKEKEKDSSSRSESASPARKSEKTKRRSCSSSSRSSANGDGSRAARRKRRRKSPSRSRTKANGRGDKARSRAKPSEKRRRRSRNRSSSSSSASARRRKRKRSKSSAASRGSGSSESSSEGSQERRAAAAAALLKKAAEAKRAKSKDVTNGKKAKEAKR
eukprot:TRINITY_DN64253_c0_g1_i1.p1 TRINITY_DN64253_c0_g1~~TRINITY_DN64253_c0_g1_i1.p1  ORF type:complete len:568 (-),score=108.81 TRINITY_DN64253_c0_g1_i1:100-1614(-)